MGLAVTKGKLNVKEISEDKKKEIRIKRAKETEEKVKKERVKIEKTREERKKKRVSLTTEPEIKPVDVEEVTVIESVEKIEETTKEIGKAKPIMSLQEPVSTEATATCKKIDTEEEEEIIEIEERAKKVIPTQESLSVEETKITDELKEIITKKPKTKRAKPSTSEQPLEEASITEVKLEEIIQKVEELIVNEEIKMAKEVTEILEQIKAKEFGPGEHPLRELAEIGYLVRNGITVKEVTVLYHEDKFPSLKSPEAQSALVNVVERKGHGPLISEVLTEETTVDEKVLAATVGFRAFMKMIELKHATVEETITMFTPDDFIQHAWESKEITEVNDNFAKCQDLLFNFLLFFFVFQETTKFVTESATVTDKTEVLIGKSRRLFVTSTLCVVFVFSAI